MIISVKVLSCDYIYWDLKIVKLLWLKFNKNRRGVRKRGYIRFLKYSCYCDRNKILL